MLRSLPRQLRELLNEDDPALWRLFPVAYPDDPGLDAEYASLVREDLLASRKRSLEVMERTLEAERLDEEQLVAWLGSLNDLRLVLGTRLDVTEDLDPDDLDDRDARTPAFALYFYLGWLQEQVVQALSEDVET